MSMTKQDFRLIASALQQSRPQHTRDGYGQWVKDAFTISNFLYAEFTNFNQAAFIDMINAKAEQSAPSHPLPTPRELSYRDQAVTDAAYRLAATTFLAFNFDNYTERNIRNLMDLLSETGTSEKGESK